MIQSLEVCTLNVNNPRFGVPNALTKGRILWFRDSNPRVQTLRVQRKIRFGIEGLGLRVQGSNVSGGEGSSLGFRGLGRRGLGV